MSKTVLVTGIGGNVAQGILRNIISLKKDIRIVGTNTERVSAGNHLCDAVYEVPYSTDNRYIPVLEEICRKHAVDLIIPSTDYEVYHLGLNAGRLPAVAASSPEVSRVFLNKYKTACEFSKRGLPFAETVLPSGYHGQFSETIVKPAEGRGSRGIHINPASPGAFSDDYIVQRLYHGTEITTAFYVTRDGNLHGHITMTRELHAGATSRCETTSVYDVNMEAIICRIMKEFRIAGSCNIQSMVTSCGEIVPFELNCRISGTNSIRAQLGFEDVAYTLDEYLYGMKPRPPRIIKGSAVRMLIDVVYPGIGLGDISDKHDKFRIF